MNGKTRTLNGKNVGRRTDFMVTLVHHSDQAGTPWGIEGKPGGVGWVRMRRALTGPYTVTNAAQSKTDEQRGLIAAATLAMLGTPYDWVGIGRNAMRAIGAQALWSTPAQTDHPPSSSAQAWPTGSTHTSAPPDPTGPAHLATGHASSSNVSGKDMTPEPDTAAEFQALLDVEPELAAQLTNLLALMPGVGDTE